MQPTDSEARAIHLGELGDRLSGLRLCDPTADERMRRSLQRRGQLTAVAAFDDGDQLQLIDGFKRLRAALHLGWSRLRVSVLQLGEAEATAAIETLHQQRGLTQLEEGWVVRSLYREHGLSQGAIAQLVGKHKSWVCRRLMLVESLDEVVQADVRLGLLSARAALTVAALPRGNQQQAAELVVERGLTTRQTDSLVDELRALDGDGARQLAMQRWPEGRCGADTRSPARHRSEGEQLIADVATLMRVGVRLEVRLLDSPLAALSADGAEHARRALGELSMLLGTLRSAVARAVELGQKADATLAHS